MEQPKTLSWLSHTGELMGIFSALFGPSKREIMAWEQAQAKEIRERVSTIVKIVGNNGAYFDKESGIGMDFQTTTLEYDMVDDCVIEHGTTRLLRVYDYIRKVSCGPEPEDYITERVTTVLTFQSGKWQNRLLELEAEVQKIQSDARIKKEVDWAEARRKRLSGQ